MRKLKVIEYLTLDGVLEDPGPTGDFAQRGWTMPYWSDDLGKAQSDELFASDVLLLGRVTYEEFVAAWPTRSGDPFTDKMNSMAKFVASKSLKPPLEWNASLLAGDTVDAVTDLKQQPGQNILVYGSPTLVRTLLASGLIDEYRFIIYPVVLGCGMRLFEPGPNKMTLALQSATSISTGVALLTYSPAER
jgi:dihydrofolate reductase